MMCPMSEENNREEYGKEGLNLPAYIERETRFIYMPNVCLLSFSNNISPGVDPEMLKGVKE